MKRVERKASVFSVISLPLVVDKSKEQELIGSEKRRFSAGLEGNSVKRGISIRDEKKYPQLVAAVGVSLNEPNWAAAVSNFWAEFNSSIETGYINDQSKVMGGRTLNASYEIDEQTGEIYADNFNDYVLFELMQKDRSVATAPDLYENKSLYDFFCIDEEVESARTKELFQIKSEATIELAKLLNESNLPEKAAYFKALAGELDTEVSSIHARTMSTEEALQSVIKASEKNPAKFLEAIKDKTLSQKRFVLDCVAAGLLTQVGNSFIYLNETFGNIDDLIAFLKSPEGQSDRAKLKAQLEEFTLIG